MAFLMLRTLLFALSVGALRPSGTNVRARPLRGSVLERESDECRLSDDGGDYCNSCLNDDCPIDELRAMFDALPPVLVSSLSSSVVGAGCDTTRALEERLERDARAAAAIDSLVSPSAPAWLPRDGASSGSDEPEDSAHERILTVLATSEPGIVSLPVAL